MSVDPTVQDNLNSLGTSNPDVEIITSLNRAIDAKNAQIADLQEKLAATTTERDEALTNLAETQTAVNEAVGKFQAAQAQVVADVPVDNQQTLAGFPTGDEPQH